MLLAEIKKIGWKLEVWLAIEWSWKQTENWEWLGANDSIPSRRLARNRV